MKIFLDTADINEIRQAARWGVLDGVTTNPSLYAKVGGSYDEILAEVCRITSGPVSAECVSDDVEGMAAEFDGAVATYREPAELRALIDRYLGDPVARRARAEPGRAAVLARHTFAHRAATIVAAISPLIEARPPGIAEARRPD